MDREYDENGEYVMHGRKGRHFDEFMNELYRIKDGGARVVPVKPKPFFVPRPRTSQARVYERHEWRTN